MYIALKEDFLKVWNWVKIWKIPSENDIFDRNNGGLEYNHIDLTIFRDMLFIPQRIQ